MSVYGERIARMEEQVKALSDKVGRIETRTDEKFEELNLKLDDLLALRNKGLGVFWLASMLLGTGVVGVFFQVITWIRGH